jgi:hypothetical protein
MSGDPTSAIAAASAAREAWSIWSDAGSLAVLVGVVLEFAELKIIERVFRLTVFPKLKESIAIIALILIAGGLALEFRGGIKISEQTTIIEKSLKTEARNAETASQTALSNVYKVNSALGQIAQREKEIGAALNRDEQTLSPRNLKPKQSAILLAELTKVPGKIYLIGRDEAEPQQYASQFIILLRKVGKDDSYVLTSAPSVVWNGVALYIPLPGNASMEEVRKDPLVVAFQKADIPIEQLFWGSALGINLERQYTKRERTILVGFKPLARLGN